VSLVTTNGLAAVEVAVNAGVDLVQQVGLVRSGSVGSRAGSLGAREVCVAEAMGATGLAMSAVSGAVSGTVGSTVVSVRVDARVGGVGNTGVVGAMSSLGDASSAAVSGSGGAQRVASGVAVGARGGTQSVTGGVAVSARGRAQSVTSGTASGCGGIASRVQAHVLAVVAVGIHARIGLVQQVAVVRAISLGGGATETTVGATSECTLVSADAMVGRLVDTGGVMGTLEAR